MKELDELYAACRTLNVNADVHEHMRKCAEILKQDDEESDKQEALNYLYTASRSIQASADVHDRLKQCALAVQQLIASTKQANESESESEVKDNANGVHSDAELGPGVKSDRAHAAGKSR